MTENFGRYEIVEELGHGGMAVVYLGFDPLVKRQVAVKVMTSQFTADPKFQQRFQFEAQNHRCLRTRYYRAHLRFWAAK